MKNIYTFVTSLFAVTVMALMALIIPQNVYAAMDSQSAVLTAPVAIQLQADDHRAEILYKYLESKHSPLAPYAPTFVEQADLNNIDWRLVVAIAGLESSFGVNIPANSYNGWGFGIYGDNVRRFDSWDDGITTVSASLRNDYMNKWNARSIADIGKLYAASPTWAVRVQGFIADIDAFSQEQNQKKLTISL